MLETLSNKNSNFIIILYMNIKSLAFREDI